LLITTQTLLTVNNHTQRLPPQAFLQCNTGFGRAYGHGRIIGLYRTSTGNNGAALCAQALYIGARLRACDPLAFTAGHGGAAIQTVRQFQPYPGHTGTHALHKTTVEFLRLRFQTGGNYVNSGIAQHLITPAGHQWVGVRAGADHTRDTGVNQAFGAGRGAAMVAAGFQSNVRGGATGLFSGHAQGVYFGVRFTGFLMPAFTDDFALLADNN